MAEDKKKRRSNINSPMKLDFPDVDKIDCATCVFREKDYGTIKGAALARCKCYPKNDKPIGILFDNLECEYYVDEKIK